MTDEQKNNPLHGLKTESMVKELVAHYGWKILFTALRFHCFKKNPSINGTVKFLRNTDWAKEKIENFYLLSFKRMPRPNDVEFNMPARARGFSKHIVPRKPMELTIQSIERSQEKATYIYQQNSNEQRANNRQCDHNDNKRDSQHKPREDPFKPVTQAKDNSRFNHNKNKERVPYDPSNPWNQ
ncbi:MAG: VF530 family DNA-binding protein [Psychromonas sp.]|nr:VF530 family DNA-binding protein [Psychromonas sp.]